jgi:hypothetical protein
MTMPAAAEITDPSTSISVLTVLLAALQVAPFNSFNSNRKKKKNKTKNKTKIRVDDSHKFSVARASI